jgi:hypothetical protein
MKLSKLLPILIAIPALVTIELVTMQPGRTVPNGCGSSGVSRYLPNSPAGANFEEACNHHDTCYETQGRSKEYCDNEFYNEMVKACSSEYGNGLKFKLCKKVAGTYHKGLQNRWGWEAYNNAQRAGR